MKAGKIYFVLYIVIIVELLVVITERDRLLSEASEAIGKFKDLNEEQYVQNLTLEIPQKTRNFVVPFNENLMETNYFVANIIPRGLVSSAEQDKIEFIAEIANESKKDFYWLPERISSRDSNKNRDFYINRSDVGGISNLILRLSWPEILRRNQTVANRISQPGGYESLNLNLMFQTPRIISRAFDAQTTSLILESIGDNGMESTNEQCDKVRLSYIYGLEDSTLSDILMNLNMKSDATREKYLLGFDYKLLEEQIEKYKESTHELRNNIADAEREIEGLVETRGETSQDESLSDVEKETEISSINTRISTQSELLKELKQSLFTYQQDLCSFYRTNVTDSFLSRFGSEEEYIQNRQELQLAKSDTVKLEIRIRNR